MKLLTVVVPCYNSEDYMKVSIDSLLIDDRIEVIIVNDGSSDQTAEIADAYVLEYPEQVQVIHKENGGHGSAIDAGLALATGAYFKVLDSDDWLNETSLKAVLEYIEHDDDVDMIVCNYVYEKKGARHKKRMHYRRYLEDYKVIDFDDVSFPLGTYFMMHSLVHKTSLLKGVNLQLPKHTFYVDNLYVFRSLAHVKSLVYLDMDLYHYFIGRDDQSVNEAIMIKRIDQQLRVNKLMIDYYLSDDAQKSAAKPYLFHHLEIINAISSIMLKIDNTPASIEKLKDLWAYIKSSDYELYQSYTKRLLGWNLSKTSKMSRFIGIFVYRITQKIFGFN